MSSKKAVMELIVWHYVRNEYEDKLNQKVPITAALKYLISSFSKYIIESTILTINDEFDFLKLLSNKIPNNKQFNLLFRASEHGFKANEFHKKCDNNGATISIIKSHFGNVFGGYTTIPWTSKNYGFRKDTHAFLFLIHTTDKSEQLNCPMMFEIKDKKANTAVYHHSHCGPIFGAGHDIIISDSCNNTVFEQLIADINTYVSKCSFNYASFVSGQSALCGGCRLPTNLCHFQVLEYEVFQIK
eukprot:173475_1